MKKYPCICLSVAGSDSSGGAGVQADIKTFSAMGCYGASVITAVTAQNTTGISAVHPVPDSIVEAQLEAVLSDFDEVNVKIGMLANAANVMAVVRSLAKFCSHTRSVVYDPVMAATTGRSLLSDDALEIIKNELFPLCTLVTPNLPEACILFGVTPESIATPENVVRQIRPRLAHIETSFLIKGGHLTHGKETVDILFHSGQVHFFSAPRIMTLNTHGTGCTLSSAICAYLSQGAFLPEAVKQAKSYLNQALTTGCEMQIGKGAGPVNHFFAPRPLILKENP